MASVKKEMPPKRKGEASSLVAGWSSARGWEAEARLFCSLSEVWEPKLSGWTWDWRWHEVDRSMANFGIVKGGYLVLERIFRRARDGALLEWEFHVLLDATYEVPVFYARAFRVDGAPLAVQRVVDELALQTQDLHISLEDHPVLQEPFLLFHACSTQELLEALAAESTQGDAHENDKRPDLLLPLLTWFLIAGPLVGLRIDPRQWPRFLHFLTQRREASKAMAILANTTRLWI